MRLLRGAYGRVAEATGYTPEHVRAVHKGRRRNAIVEALLLEEAEKAAALGLRKEKRGRCLTVEEYYRRAKSGVVR